MSFVVESQVEGEYANPIGRSLLKFKSTNVRSLI